MSEAVVDGGAPAPAESFVQINTDQVHVPDPVSGRPAQEPVAPKPEAAKAEGKPAGKPSIDDALKNALTKAQAKANDAKEAVAAKEKAEAPKVEAKAEAKPEPKTERGPDGKFQPKAADPQAQAQQPAQGQQPAPQKPVNFADPPARFHDGAKQEWANAPESVRAEVHRMEKEFEKGIEKYKASHERYDTFRQYDDEARKHGHDLRATLDRLNNIGLELQRDPVRGLELALQQSGPRKPDGSPFTLLEIASHVMNQKPEERAMQQSSQVAALESKIAQLEQQLSGVTTTIQKQQENTVIQQVSEFQKDHPRFEELSDDIAFFLQTKRASSLQEAYELAERLNPSSEPAPLIPAQTQQQPAAHTGNDARPLKPAGQKSISGSPPSAADLAPVKKGPTPSIDEALQKALRKAS